jgi:hypothetical protein
VELGLAEIAGDGGGEFGVSNFGLATYDDTDGDGIPDVKVPNITTGLTAGILQGDDFSLPVLISALQERRDTNVLNVPSVLVNNNGSAQVESKDAQPTTQITATGGVSGQTQENFREYVEAGITLDISPTISASRYLRLSPRQFGILFWSALAFGWLFTLPAIANAWFGTRGLAMGGGPWGPSLANDIIFLFGWPAMVGVHVAFALLAWGAWQHYRNIDRS